MMGKRWTHYFTKGASPKNEVVISELRSMGVDVDALLKLKPAKRALNDLRDGLLRLRDSYGFVIATR
jgi:hypothetical protein